MNSGTLRVGVVSPTQAVASLRGGTSVFIDNILAASDFDALIFTLMDQGISRVDDRSEWVSLGSWPAAGRLGGANLWGLAGFVRIARRYRRHVDIWYVHRAELAIPLTLVGVPYVYHVHGKATRAAEFSRFRVIRSGLAVRVYGWLVRWVALRARHLVAVSAEASDELSRLGVRPERISLVPTAVDTASFHPGSVVTEGRIMYLGRLVSNKRVDLVIRSVALLVDCGVDVHLVIAGEGPERRALEQMGARLLGHRIRFLGWVARQTLPAVVRTSAVSVLASEGEGMPTTVLESLACGVPPVVSIFGGSADAVRDGLDGVVVSEQTAPAYAAAIQQVLNGGQPMRDNAAEGSRRFDVSVVAAEIGRVLRRAAEGI